MKKLLLTAYLAVVGLVGTATSALAADSIDSGDTAFILLCAALVMLMTPGLAFFYAGMARKKNLLATMMHSFFILCLVGVQWVLWGYSLAFSDGGSMQKYVGGLGFMGLSGIGMEAKGTIPHYLFMIFQGMFAIITAALITGAFAERMKFSAMIIFTLLWTTIVYDPLCHWVWGGGWIHAMGALDFAGGTVVHISSGVSALVAAIVIGKRKGFPSEHMAPHNLGYTLLGCALLWFGWFGFNAGSELAADGVAAMAFVVTNTAAAAGGLAWVLVEWVHRGRPTALGLASGAVAGLVGITPAAGFVGPLSSIVIGLGAGILCYFAVTALKPMFGYDDSLDVFGIHGIGGIWGAIATGLFAFGDNKGLFFGGGFEQTWIQIISVVATIVFAAVVTFIILKIVDAVIGLRVSEEEETMGLDLAVHGEKGYNF